MTESMHININLYSVDGKIQQNLLNTFQHPGQKEFSFNKAALKPGIYVLRVVGNNGISFISEQIIIE